MAYRISYLDNTKTPRLIAVADTFAEAETVVAALISAVPDTAGRLVSVEDPLWGHVSRVVQSPENLDAAGGLPVLYLGGTSASDTNWQAEAIKHLSAEQVIIVNPRRERAPTDKPSVLTQIAWQRRHLWAADFGLFWFEGPHPDPLGLMELGEVLLSSLHIALGMPEDYPLRDEICANVADVVPDLVIHHDLRETVSAAVQLVQDPRRRRVRLPHHDVDPAASAMCVMSAIAGLKQGTPGLSMRLNELVIEVGCAAGHGLDPSVLARIYVSVDRLRIDPDDALGWASLLEVAHELDPF